MRKELFELQILVHGRQLNEYGHQSETFVEGRRESEYALRVFNHSPRRVAAVLSVDGLSVMTGKLASSEDPAYIVGAYSSVEIPGWRLNDKDVAHFIFSSLPKAYATQMGQPTNIGVIGANLFYEKQVLRSVFSMQSIASKGLCDESIFGATRGVGTGFGQKTEHQVQRVSFNREPIVCAQLVLRYDDEAGLRKRGIKLSAAHNVGDRVIEADPFPGDSGCKPPAGWRG